MKAKRIALVIHSLGRGGAEKVVSELSLYWAKQGHHVTLIVFDGRRMDYPYGGELIDLAIYSVQGAFSKVGVLLRRAMRLRQCYRAQTFDHIIAVMESASFPSLLATPTTIASNHCNPALYFSKLEWLLARFLFPRARQVICVAKRAQTIFQQALPLARFGCIYNPIDLQRLRQFAQQSPAVVMTGPYIIAVGRLEAQKRMDRLIAAYARSRLQQHAQLLILGEGSLRPQLEAQIQQLGLRHRILMPGTVPNPHPNVAQADFLVLSSDHEGFPMVLIEALALGRPVIATNCATGPDEIIQPNSNGFLVPVNDVEALSLTMDKLFFDRSLQQRLSAAAPASVAHLALEQIAAQWLAL